jgi:integrase
VEGTEKTIQHFDADELLGFLGFLQEKWPEVRVAASATKVLLWSCCRRLEVAGLKWENVRSIDGQIHFEVVGKWGVERWFRVPEQLYQQMILCRTSSPFVFAAYVEQIARVHSQNSGCLKRICSNFTPSNFGRWLYERVKDWAVTQPRGTAYLHIFRKTGLQLAHDGEEVTSKRVADDAGVSESVLLGHYVKPKLWRQSNRTFRRLLASLPPRVAAEYGYTEDERSRLERQLGMAMDSGNWTLVQVLAERLRKMADSERQQAG